MGKDDDTFALYNSLLELENSENPSSTDDGEDFITSKDIAKMKKKEEDDGPLELSNPMKIEEEIHFRRFTQKRKYKYTETEMAAIKEGCKYTLVHDYGPMDIYHISDEERRKNDQLAEISLKLSRLKRTYRRVDQYIEAMRTVYEAWEILAKSNYVHTKEEFFRLVSKGKIISNRILMPKLKGINKYNMDMIIAYISNPELDVSKLAPKKEDDYLFEEEEEETEEEEMCRLLSEDEVRYILAEDEEVPSIRIQNLDKKYVKGYDRNVRFGKKKKEKRGKKFQEIKEDTSDMLKKIQRSVGNRYSFSSYSLTNNIFKADNKKKSVIDERFYNFGSWRDDANMELYNLSLFNEFLDIKDPSNPYMRNADLLKNHVFDKMDEMGMNTIEVRKRISETNAEKLAEEKRRTAKSNKKREKKLMEKVVALNKNKKFNKLVEKNENKYIK